MASLIGFEGLYPIASSIAWGAGALSLENGKVLNSKTKNVISQEEFERLVEKGHASKLATPVPISDEFIDDKIVVAILNNESEHAGILRADAGKLGGLVKPFNQGGYSFLAFESLGAFDQYAEDRINVILERVFSASLDIGELQPLLRLGMSLDSSHPYLNVAWAILSGNLGIHRDLARANVRENKKLEFDELLQTYDQSDDEYSVKYQDGVAAGGGGLDLDIARKTIEAFHSLHTSIRPVLIEKYRFLEEYFNPPRMRRLEAASATMVFTAALEDRSLAEKLARAIELRELQRALSGEQVMPLEAPKLREFEGALARIIEPSPETKVTHKPIGHEESRPVVPHWSRSGIETTSPIMRLLGFQSGLSDEAKKIEICVSASLTLKVSAIDNGKGNRPQGVAYLHEEENFLFRPAIFTVSRTLLETGTSVYHLNSVSFLDETGQTHVTAFPSLVAQNAFFLQFRLSVRTEGNSKLRIGEHIVRRGKRSLDDASAWMSEYSLLSRDYELKRAIDHRGTWLPPPRPHTCTALDRVMVALSQHDGRCEVRALVKLINEQFNVRVRVNNTRRVQIQNPALLRFDEGDSRVLVWTEQGRGYAWALSQILSHAT